jgi:predicted Zn finger-like uncharacterized protein
MIIECPRCSKQYDLDKLGVKLPPEGRSVRCKQCDQVWRAMPLQEEDSLPEGTDEPEADESAESAAAGHPAAWEESSGTASQAAAQRQQFRGWESSGSEEQAESQEDAGFEVPEAEGRAAIGDEDPALGRNTGKVSWFGSFLRKNNARQSKAEPVFDEQQPQPSAQTIPFPRPAAGAAGVAPPEEEYRTLDDARAAVRNVFSSLEPRPNASASIIQAPVTGGQEELQDRHFAMHGHSDASLGDAETGFPASDQTRTGSVGWPAESEAGNGVQSASRWAGAAGWQPEAEAEAGAQPESSPEQGGFAAGAWLNAEGSAGQRPQEQAPQNWPKGWQPELPQDPDDPDAQLRNAMRAQFPPRALPVEPAQPGREEEPEAAEGQVAEALTAFWQRPTVHRPAGEPAAPQQEESDSAEGEASFDERLYREIEETQEHAKKPRLAEGKGGGLALTAAWGLFLCIAGGLTAGLFAFRDIAADALPGLVPFYQALGMPVTAQPLVFEGTQYDWSLTDNKPVLHIKGSVYNRAQHNINVPDLVITVKDDDPALDREIPASLPVDGSKIGPGEHTDFEVELLTPSPSINAIELELRDVR